MVSGPNMVLGISALLAAPFPIHELIWLHGRSLRLGTYSSHFTEAKLSFQGFNENFQSHAVEEHELRLSPFSFRRPAALTRKLSTAVTAIPTISGQTTQTIRAGQFQQTGKWGSKAPFSLPGPTPRAHPLAFSPGPKASSLVL